MVADKWLLWCRSSDLDPRRRALPNHQRCSTAGGGLDVRERMSEEALVFDNDSWQADQSLQLQAIAELRPSS